MNKPRYPIFPPIATWAFVTSAIRGLGEGMFQNDEAIRLSIILILVHFPGKLGSYQTQIKLADRLSNTPGRFLTDGGFCSAVASLS